MNFTKLRKGDIVRWDQDLTLYRVLDIDTTKTSNEIFWGWNGSDWNGNSIYKTTWANSYNHINDLISKGQISIIERGGFYLKPLKFI